jgi:hypothetical protein
MGNKMLERHVYDYVDACVRDELRDASAMHRQFSIFGNSAVNALLDIPPRDFQRASPGGMTMKRLWMVLACLVCLGMAAVSGSAAAGSDMNQGGNGASGSSTTTNSSGGGY